ncbi:MAG: precorrin-6A synthase (deacetylating), partial [Gluconacetobacter diazotrophicus]|nr:precorrin-6A synthase (deacetylating) [Gluconacetobacter diazotrophicus]
DIHWGAYLGMPEEILISGRLRDVSAEILRRRRDARAANGWIMDSYILHRRAGGD